VFVNFYNRLRIKRANFQLSWHTCGFSDNLTELPDNSGIVKKIHFFHDKTNPPLKIVVNSNSVKGTNAQTKNTDIQGSRQKNRWFQRIELRKGRRG
jgi:hypothetical protein